MRSIFLRFRRRHDEETAHGGVAVSFARLLRFVPFLIVLALLGTGAEPASMADARQSEAAAPRSSDVVDFAHALMASGAPAGVPDTVTGPTAFVSASIPWGVMTDSAGMST